MSLVQHSISIFTSSYEIFAEFLSPARLRLMPEIIDFRHFACVPSMIDSLKVKVLFTT